MANQWFKFYGAEYLSDPKMDRLTVQERSCWLTLLCMASQSNGIIKYLSIEGLLNKSGIHFDPYDSSEWDNAQNVLRTFEQYEMISIHKNGNVEIKNWEKRQEHNLTVAERVAKSRANKKNVTSDVTSVTTDKNRIEENRVYSNNTQTNVLRANRVVKKGIPKTLEAGITRIISMFEEIDAKNKDNHAIAAHRNACVFLIETYGLEEVLAMIPKLKETNKTSFYQITTPLEMKKNIVKVFNDIQRKSVDIKSKGRGFA